MRPLDYAPRNLRDNRDAARGNFVVALVLIGLMTGLIAFLMIASALLSD